MDVDPAARVIALFEGRGQLDRLEHVHATAAPACLARPKERLSAASVLIDARLWEPAFTIAYNAYRTAADSVVLFLGYRVPATPGGHRIATDIAHTVRSGRCRALSAATSRVGVLRPVAAVEKTAADAPWAVG